MHVMQGKGVGATASGGGGLRVGIQGFDRMGSEVGEDWVVEQVRGRASY